MSPKRIQRKRTKGWRMPEGAVYVGRPSKWGNPFGIERIPHWPKWAGRAPWRVVARDGRVWTIDNACKPIVGREAADHARKSAAAKAAVELFALHVGPMGDYEIERDDLEALRGHDLACWCPLDQPCHADVLLELANGDKP